MIYLPYRVRPQSLAAMNKIEFFAISLVTAMSEHEQARWQASNDPANDRVAWRAFLKRLRNRAGLPMEMELIGSGGRSSASPSIASINRVDASLLEP